MKVIIGAGISGLSTAINLDQKFIVLEKSSLYGGLSGQYQDNGYWFDYSGHYFHFKNYPTIKIFLENYSEFRCYHRKSKVFTGNQLIPFPLQANLSFLPRRLARAILNEIPDYPIQQATNLEELLKYNFGNHLYNLFFSPFIEKYYLKSPEKLLSNMDKGSIPPPDKKKMLKGFQGKQRFDNEGYNPVFFYPVIPLRNLIDKIAKPIKNQIILNEAVETIDLKKKRLYTKSNQYDYDVLVNTLPLKEFLSRTLPKHTFPEYHLLENISTLLTNVVLKKRKRRFHWVYIPERNIPFYRIGFYPNTEHPICYLEKSINPVTITQKTNLDIKEIIFSLKRLGIIESQKDIVYISQLIIPVSYVIFNLQWKKTVPTILKQLEGMDIYSIGRYGSWNYTSMSEDIQNAIKTAKKINKKRKGK